MKKIIVCVFLSLFLSLSVVSCGPKNITDFDDKFSCSLMYYCKTKEDLRTQLFILEKITDTHYLMKSGGDPRCKFDVWFEGDGETIKSIKLKGYPCDYPKDYLNNMGRVSGCGVYE